MDAPASLDAPPIRFRSPVRGLSQSGRLAILRVRVATGMLWALIALAALGGLRGLAARTAAAPPSTGAPAAVAGFAELYVATYLEAGAGQEQSLTGFYPQALDLAGVSAGARYVARAAAVATESLGPRYWAVTVGADVLVASAGGYQPEGTQYYRVAVESSLTGMVATTLPAAVAAPAPARLPRLAVPAITTGTAPDPSLGAEVTSHLGRALGVTATLDALALAPATGTERLAVARVTATDAGGIPEVLDYTLRLRRQGDRWALDAVLPGPPLTPVQPSSLQPSSVQPSSVQPREKGATQ